MIWKAACLPRSTSEHGLQYVTVDQFKMILGKPRDDPDFLRAFVQLRAAEGDKPTRRNPSAYFWDAGLWTACKESRDVIAGYLDIDNWKLVQARPSTEWTTENFPMRLKSHDQNKELTTMVFPNRDIICITSVIPYSMWDTVLRAFFLDNRKQSSVYKWNMAFAFDDSWIIDMPGSDEEMWDECPVRGAIYTMVMEWLDLDTLRKNPPYFWLVVPNFHWVAQPGVDCETVYRTCNAEYLHISWEALEATGFKPAVLKFIETLERISDESVDEGEVRQAIKLLVRKD
ncbi:hypothetical protein NW768_004941 [Fusarium equiseti]|uniref:Uncharacterized protein n=1 Tax=Fusarium equiseti TaxID=61235 RepID=A0ABQ8RIB5_FUSEQ|nr:hypothetical protein NW768_004941 [Fusarium equiseti]